MNFRKILAKGIYFVTRDNKKAAKVLGVKYGKECKFIGNPISMFGSEPWAISIGDHVELTNGVQIITHDGALWVARSLDESLKKADIIKNVTIGNNVFIGTNSVILCGVHIGDNVIIGAGSIVNKDIPSNCVAVGVPCRLIKNIDEYIGSVKNENTFLNTKDMTSKQKRKEWENI